MAFENKLVAIINKELESGIALNALAHASLVMGADIGKDPLQIENYADLANNIYPISALPFIILRAKSSEIRKIVRQANDLNIKQISFLESMTGGTYQEQMVRTSSIAYDDLKFSCTVMFGQWDLVSEITKKLSLYK